MSRCFYVCMHVCMCVCMSLCLYVCMSFCLFVCMSACIYIYIYICVYVYLCTNKHSTHIYIYIYTYIEICTYTYIWGRNVSYPAAGASRRCSNSRTSAEPTQPPLLAEGVPCLGGVSGGVRSRVIFGFCGQMFGCRAACFDTTCTGG